MSFAAFLHQREIYTSAKVAMRDATAKLAKLMDSFTTGALSTEDFCSAYERAWNFEISDSDVEENEREAFRALFDIVVWYSPFAGNPGEYRGDRNDEDILRAVREAQSKIKSI